MAEDDDLLRLLRDLQDLLDRAFRPEIIKAAHWIVENDALVSDVGVMRELHDESDRQRGTVAAAECIAEAMVSRFSRGEGDVLRIDDDFIG